MLEQLFLAIDTAAVAHQVIVGANHTVTGNDDGDGIFAVGRAHCPYLVGITQSLRQLSVVDRLSIGNFEQLFPDLPLKVGSLGRKRQVKIGSAAFEVLIQLVGHLRKDSGFYLLR